MKYIYIRNKGRNTTFINKILHEGDSFCLVMRVGYRLGGRLYSHIDRYTNTFTIYKPALEEYLISETCDTFI